MTVSSVRVGEISDQVRGVTYKKAEAAAEQRPGFLPLLRATNITERGLILDDLVFVPEEKVSAKQRLRKNDIVIATSSGSIDVVGKAAPVDFDFEGSFGAFCKVVRPKDGVFPGYLAHYFRTPLYRRTISALAAGININNLRNEHIDDLQVRLPPIKEQRRIASILDEADRLRTLRQRSIDQLDGLGQSVFHQMFETEISSDDDEEEYLGEIVDEFRYGTSNKSSGAGVATLRIPNIIGGKINLDDLKTVVVNNRERERLRLKGGDLLFVRTNGNPAYVGRSAVVPEHMESKDFIFASYLIRARMPSIAVATFVQAYMTSHYGRKQLLENAKTSAGQYNINIEGLSSIRIPRAEPSKKELFLERRSNAERPFGHYQESQRVLDRLFSSLQQRAFRGEL